MVPLRAARNVGTPGFISRSTSSIITVNFITITVIFDLNWISIGSQLDINWISYKLDLNWISIGYQLDISWISLGYQLDITWISIRYQLDINWISIGYQCDKTLQLCKRGVVSSVTAYLFRDACKSVVIWSTLFDQLTKHRYRSKW